MAWEAQTGSMIHRTHHIIVVTAIIYYKGRIQSKPGKGIRCTGWSLEEASNSPFPIEPHGTLSSPSMELWRCMWSVANHRSPWEDQCPQSSWGADHTALLMQNVHTFQAPEGKRMFSISPIISTGWYHEPHLSVNGWETSWILFPDASQGPTLQAGVFKDSSIGLTW